MRRLSAVVGVGCRFRDIDTRLIVRQRLTVDQSKSVVRAADLGVIPEENRNIVRAARLFRITVNYLV